MTFRSSQSKNAARWKYVVNRRIATERNLSSRSLKCSKTISMLEHAHLMKSVQYLGKFYSNLVQKFIVNLTDDVNNLESPDFRKVHVCCHKFAFSLDVINDFLGRPHTHSEWSPLRLRLLSPSSPTVRILLSLAMAN